jgi:nitroreductase
MRKTRIIPVIIGLLMIGNLAMGQDLGNPVSDLILSSYSSRSFNSVPLTDEQIELVLQCGVKAPSARNSQTWKYTVVKDSSLAKKIIPDTKPGNILIVISGPEAVQEGIPVDINCALSSAYMFLGAQSLGLAARLYTGPVRGLNESLRKELEIPEDYRAVIVLRMGNIDNYLDGVSSATPRKDMKDLVTYK